MSAGAGTTVGSASVSLALTHNRYQRLSDNQLTLSLSLPLSVWLPARQDAGFLSYGLSRNKTTSTASLWGMRATALATTSVIRPVSSGILRGIQSVRISGLE
ncbi:hypothetical protein DMB90_13145 [Raoultella planticola]|uniref:Uncharacterized protein n=1 Tax=Raoultella planticola TaxID=575 RepID=A0A5P6A9Z7_RAOPL|nr:hypothetical protein DMB90_13145 [Raoultella planticola]